MRKGLEKSVRCYGTRVSNYRPYAYGMKKEGRCWGKEGCLAMARALAGLQNEAGSRLFRKVTPVEVPKSAALRKALRSALKKSLMVPYVGMRNGGIDGDTESRAAIGHVSSIFCL